MNARLPQWVYVNGRLQPAARACISVFDRGLLYGDGLFETLRAYSGRPFGLAQHLDRLQRSAEFLGIRVPRAPWQEQIRNLLRRNQLQAVDAAVRITLTRGPAGASGLLPPPRPRPTVVISALRLPRTLATAQREGVRVTLLPFSREGALAEHKVLNYLPAVLGKRIAARHDAFEGLFVDSEGLIREGTTTNVFVRRHGQLLTPPVAGILGGLTRRLVMEAAAVDGAQVREQPLKPRELLSADEAFVTSSLAEIIPITAVDTHRIGGGRVGPLTRRLQALYRQIVDQQLATA